MLTKITDHLWIGNAADGRNLTLVYQEQFNVVVDLAVEELPIPVPRELSYYRIPLEDGGDNDLRLIVSAIQVIAFSISKGLKTLVCCSAGLSRSPAIAAAAIASYSAMNLDDSLREVANVKHCDVSPALWRDVTRAHRELVHS